MKLKIVTPSRTLDNNKVGKNKLIVLYTLSLKVRLIYRTKFFVNRTNEFDKRKLILIL